MPAISLLLLYVISVVSGLCHHKIVPQHNGQDFLILRSVTLLSEALPALHVLAKVVEAETRPYGTGVAGSRLDVHVRLRGDVNVDIRLCGYVLVGLIVDVWHGSNLLVNVWLCWNLSVHIRRWQTSGSGK